MRKFFYFISKEKLTAKNAAIILGITYFFNNLLGGLRDIIIGVKFGASRLPDIYFASFSLPDLIFNLIILGAIGAAFIPVFVEYVSAGKKEEANHIANSVLNFFLIISLVFATVIFILAPKLIPALVPGFFETKTDVNFNILQVTVNTTRIMLLSPIFFCISGIFGGILNSYKKFIAYSLAPIIYNLSIISAALFLTKQFSVPVYALAIGVIIGAFLHMFIQLPSVLSSGFHYKFVMDFKEGAIARIIKLMTPRALTIGISQVNLFVGTFVASYFIGGKSVLTYANNIQTVPSVVFGIAIATAIFPYLSESFSQKNMDEFMDSFSWGFRRIIFFLIPATVGLIVLRAQIIRLLFGYGNFDWYATYWTTKALGFFAISLVAQGLVPLCVRTFYAIHDTKTPLYIAIFEMIAFVILAFVLPFNLELGPAGIALAFSIASFVNIILLLWFLNEKIGTFDPDHKIFESTFRLVIASVLMGLFVYGSLNLFDRFVDTHRVFGLLAQTLGSIGIGTVAYFGLTYLFGCEETKFVLKRLKLTKDTKK